jgi:RND family efflux transporter MFP subunit
MESRQKRPIASSLLVTMAVIVAVIAIGGVIAAYFMNNKPTVQRAAPRQQVLLVKALTAERAKARAVVSGMGTVVPSQQITLRARVSGTVQAMSGTFVPGGRVAKDGEILRIDPRDYEIEVAKAQSGLRKARADFELEQGRQSVARQELELLREAYPEPIDQTDLALRKPQLHQAEANIAIAEAQLAQARLDLSRTILRAPFNALIVDRQVDLGAHVGSQDPLATLASTDEFWIEAAVPMERLGYIDFKRAAVGIFSQTGSGEWSGRALHALGSIDESTRMAKVLVSVKNPMDTGKDGRGRPLMLGDYVRVEIQGRDLGELIALPRAALRRGDAVWIVNDSRLEIRKVEIAWRTGDEVYVASGLEQGETVVMSDIAAPVPGMAIEVAKPGRAAPASGGDPGTSDQGQGS